ncbi:hypothetical protein BDQ17DRAFT_1339761 [Cyathus striatus]|nr:hypothetical protein BDQ17DRAFT_1339761 [Cyathus striatus]
MLFMKKGDEVFSDDVLFNEYASEVFSDYKFVRKEDLGQDADDEGSDLEEQGIDYEMSYSDDGSHNGDGYENGDKNEDHEEVHPGKHHKSEYWMWKNERKRA